ncbi:MAG: hypothetical protein ACYTGB_07475 [Planctomycetota bacterium]|jgi:hypothetical protein
MRPVGTFLICALACLSAAGGEVKFAAKPAASKAGGKVKITFSVSGKTDVEVAVLDSKGKVVRHLAGGVLGGKKPPPPPLKAGTSQSLEWDMKDDFGKPAAGGPFRVRVRAGTGVKFGGFIGEDPYTVGGVNSLACDEEGKLYVMFRRGGANQDVDVLRVYSPDGKYLRTLIPGPADLKPERAAAWARWDAERKCFFPKNYRSQMPEFYPWRSNARIVSASQEAGLVLTAGVNTYRMAPDGGDVKGPFKMWSKAKPKNPKWNIPQLAVSPDGKYIYYSNVAGTKYNPKAFADTDPNWPQGRVYRQEAGAGSDPAKFYDLELPPWEKGKYWLPNAWNKRTAAYGMTVDGKGHVYVCDLVNQGVTELDLSGKKVSFTPVPWPERVHVDAASGNYYLIIRTKPPRDGYTPVKLVKVAGRGDAGKVVAEMPLKRGLGSATALGKIGGKPVLWIGGSGAMICVRDAGASFEVVDTAFKPKPEAQLDWNRLSVDYERDEVYTSNGTNLLYRYDGKTGRGGLLKVKGKPLHGVDVAVGYDGLLYVRTGRSYSGPLERWTRDLEPAPFKETGTHVLSKHIYSRFGVGNCEKGLGVGPKGESYINFMYGWNLYFIAGFGGNGKPIKGKYLEKQVGNYADKKRDPKKPGPYPPDLDTAVIGPVPASSGGVRVDLAGNIYLGIRPKPEGFTPPPGFEKDPAYANWTGSIVKFGPAGGTVLGLKGAESKMPDAPKITLVHGRGKYTAENALAAYGGVGPISGNGWGGGGSCCVCRVPRFGVDRYGRLTWANALTNTITMVDNAGNLVVEFGKYGNFDSQYVNSNLKEGQEKKPTVAVPEFPFAWATGAGATDGHIYANDTYNRRALRADKTWAAEETIPVK